MAFTKIDGFRGMDANLSEYHTHRVSTISNILILHNVERRKMTLNIKL